MQADHSHGFSILPALADTGKIQVRLKTLREATSEQFGEILSMAIKKAKEADNLSRRKEAAEEANGDPVKAAKQVVSIYNSIVPPILSAQGFEEVPVLAFLDQVDQVAQRYDRFIQHDYEFHSVMLQGDAHFNKHIAELSNMHARRAHSILHSKQFSKATMEQLDEILSMAVKKANEPDNLSTLEAAFKEHSAQQVVSICHSILAPILSAKGFEEVPIAEVVHQSRHFARRHARFIGHVIEFDEIMRLRTDA